MPEDHRNRLDVRGIAPATYIPDDLCNSIRNYASAKDPIPMIDIKGKRKYAHTLQILRSHPSASLLDHSIESPTFERIIQREVEQYIKGIK